MAPSTFRFIPALAVVALAVLLLAPRLGRGEDTTTALAGFQPYMPGSPIPQDADCESMSGFYDDPQVLCRTEGGPYCERGYMIGREGVIVHTTFYRCNFPVAYLVAEYGRYEGVRRYRGVLVLRWPQAYAHVRREGWLNAMQPVSIVTWWKPPEPAEDSSY